MQTVYKFHKLLLHKVFFITWTTYDNMHAIALAIWLWGHKTFSNHSANPRISRFLVDGAIQVAKNIIHNYGQSKTILVQFSKYFFPHTMFLLIIVMPSDSNYIIIDILITLWRFFYAFWISMILLFTPTTSEQHTLNTHV